MQNVQLSIKDNTDPPTRLFVPLASDPYEWFLSGKKKWELRACKRQFTKRHIYPGRRVELRRGYSDPDASIWGFIEQVVVFNTLKEVFFQIPYNEIIPAAKDTNNAINAASRILRMEPDQKSQLIAFRIKKDTSKIELPIDMRYVDRIRCQRKSTTIRNGVRDIPLGPAVLSANKTKIPIIITKVRFDTVGNLSECDATADGFLDLPELHTALKYYYPDIGFDDMVTVITYRVSQNESQGNIFGSGKIPAQRLV